MSEGTESSPRSALIDKSVYRKIGQEYPYKHGSSGIPFTKFLSHAAVTDHYKTTYIGSRNTPITVEIDNKKGSILTQVEMNEYLTQKYEYLHLEAYVNEDGFLEFNVATKMPDATYHPDFHAKPFITMSLDYFTKKGIPHKGIYSNFEAGSDTYRLFMAEYNKTHNQMEAAKHSFSYPIFANRGYAIRDIIVKPGNGVYITYRKM